MERRMTLVKTFSMMERHRPAMMSSALRPLRCSVMMLLFMTVSYTHLTLPTNREV